MAMQRTTEGRTGQHSYSREQAEPFAIRALREDFEAHSPRDQERIRADVLTRLRAERTHTEFGARDDKGRRRGSELSRMAKAVYGVWLPED